MVHALVKPALAAVLAHCAIAVFASEVDDAETAAAPARTSAVSEPPAAPLALVLRTPHGQTRFARGEQISLLVAPSQDAHVYCYLQDENQKLVRFFPNRFARDSFVSAAAPVELPGAMGFRMSLGQPGARETVTCFATARDVSAELPAAVVGVDLEALPATSMQQIRSAFVNASGGSLAQENLHLQGR